MSLALERDGVIEGPLPPWLLPLDSSPLSAEPVGGAEPASIYLHARYYDPTLGTFLSPDPSHPARQGVGTNRFAYGFGNPVNGADRTGLYWCGDNGGWCEEVIVVGDVSDYGALTQDDGGDDRRSAQEERRERREEEAKQKAGCNGDLCPETPAPVPTPTPTPAPPPRPTKPPKGPKPFPNPDAAATDALKKAIPLTNQKNQEICFSVCQGQAGYIVVVSPRLGDSGSCTHFEKCPSGTSLDAYGHTHPPGGWPGYSGGDVPYGSGDITSYLGLSTGEMYRWDPGASSPTLIAAPPATPYPTPPVWPWP